MNLIDTKISDLLILEPKVFGDHPGYFFESYNNLINRKAILQLPAFTFIVIKCST